MPWKCNGLNGINLGGAEIQLIPLRFICHALRRLRLVVLAFIVRPIPRPIYPGSFAGAVMRSNDFCPELDKPPKPFVACQS
jgi:hypothetical protein